MALSPRMDKAKRKLNTGEMAAKRELRTYETYDWCNLYQETRLSMSD